ncbi:MAG: PAS domain S-box protein, partial [Deltaproteobacteria bacterium]|nr:PAS domain S-box protein [Deltaproteobacteria bacterium]
MATLLTGVALGIVLLFGAVRAFWADWAMEDLVLHAILETVTGLTAALGGILLLHRRGTAAEARFVLPALGLVGMGVVCLVHTTTAPGNAFILLRTLADLVGGVLAAFTWLPLRPGPRLERRARGLAWVVLAAASLLVVWVLAARGMFPVMVRDGHFTPALVGMRVIAGLGFLAAACRLVLDAAEQERRVAWPLAVCMLIFGVSSLLFSWWSLWDVRWWAWHVCAALAPLVLVVALAADYAEALRRVSKSEEQFRQVTESLPQLVWTCRADGPCDYLGPQWIAFTGIPEAPQLGYGWLEQLHPDDRERTIKQWSEAAPVGGPFDLEFRIRRHDGVYRWFRTRALPLRDESGHVVKWFGSNLDVEDYKRAEHDLRHTEKQFRTAFENAAVGRSLTRPDGKLAMVNSAFAEMVGLTIEEMQEINVLQITHPEDLRISKESIRCLLAGEQQTFRFEKRYVHKDGHLVWTDVSTTLVRDEQGNPVNFVTDIVDLTQRKKMEEELRLSQRELTIRNRIVEIFLTSDGEQAYDEVMNVFLEAMESKYGVFGYIDENGAYVVPTMTRHIWDNCKVSDKDIVFPRATWGDSSWPTAIREKRTICINEPSVRTPKGHIPITRHISLPLIYRDQVIGLLQVANKQTDYAPADVRLFETIGRFIAPVLDARLQRDRQERIRRESEERFRGFFKLTADLACIATLSDARFIELNPAWEKTLGYTQEELTSRSFIDFIHPDDKEPTLRVVREKLEAGELVLRFENRYLRKDGGVVWLEWTSQPFTATDRTFAIARDITPRKLEEQAASERDWLKSGIVQLNDAVRGDLDLKSLCGKAISQMAGRLDAKVGAVYIVESGGDG